MVAIEIAIIMYSFMCWFSELTQSSLQGKENRIQNKLTPACACTHARAHIHTHTHTVCRIA